MMKQHALEIPYFAVENQREVPFGNRNCQLPLETEQIIWASLKIEDP